MYSISAERSAGWSGLAFLVVVIMASALAGTPPGIGASPATIGMFLSAHHHMAMVANWLVFPAAFFFLWFAVGVRAHLAHAAATGDGLPLYALCGAIAAEAVSFASAGVMAMLLLTPVPGDDLPAWWTFYLMLAGPVISAPTVLFVFATAHSMKRHGSASQGLALYGYLTALGLLVGTLSVFWASGPMSPSGWVTLVLGLGLFAIWIIATSIWLIRNAGRPAAAQ